MALSVFEDPSQPPSPDALRQALGPSADLWFALLLHVRSGCPPLSELWHHSGARFGWSLRLKQRERVILYVTPQHGGFLVGLVLGERAARIAEAGSLPPLALAALAAAPRYAEGRGLRVSVSSPEGLVITGQWVQGPRKLAFSDMRALQLDPAVGAIVLYTNGQEFVQTGLPMDAFDLLVMTAPPGRSTIPVQVQAMQLFLSYCKRQVFALGQGNGAPPPAALKTASQLPWTALDDQPEVLVAALVDAMLQAEAAHATDLHSIDLESQGVNT